MSHNGSSEFDQEDGDETNAYAHGRRYGLDGYNYFGGDVRDDGRGDGTGISLVLVL
jgi:hypothetical protein